MAIVRITSQKQFLITIKEDRKKYNYEVNLIKAEALTTPEGEFMAIKRVLDDQTLHVFPFQNIAEPRASSPLLMEKYLNWIFMVPPLIENVEFAENSNHANHAGTADSATAATDSAQLGGLTLTQIQNNLFSALFSQGGEGDLGGLTWNGTAPSGTISKKYKFTRVANLVTFFVKITASIAGLLNSYVEFELPSVGYSPNIWASQPINSILCTGNGCLLAGINASVNGNAGVKLYKNSLGAYIVRIETTVTVATLAAFCTISYLTTNI